MPKSKNTEIVLSYLKRFPNASSLTLARKIYEENNLYFSSVETVRSSVRYFRGAQGKAHRKCVKLEKPITPKMRYNDEI